MRNLFKSVVLFFCLLFCANIQLLCNESDSFSSKDEILLNILINKDYSAADKNGEIKEFYVTDEIKSLLFTKEYENGENKTLLSNYYAKDNNDSSILEILSNLDSNNKIDETNSDFLLPDENENLLQKKSAEIEFADLNHRFSFSSYQNEILETKSTDNETIVSFSSGTNLKRNFYDEQKRVVKIQKWFIKDFTESKKLSEELFFYQENQNNPHMSTLSENDNYTKTYHNEESLPVSKEVYNQFANKKQRLDYINSWKYDENKNVVEEKKVEYKYRKNRESPISFFETKYIYQYHDNSAIPRDFDYYENNVLKMKTVYFSQFEYENQVFFENNYTVQTFYKNGTKVKDVFISNGTVIREKDYE